MLRRELAALDLVPAPAPAQTVSAQVAPLTAGPRTPADKVKLFRQLFRGRPDIYPTRFVSNKTGKPGYAPACSNKFVRGVCELPKVKCGDCTRQAFRPVDDAAVVAHLKGQHVMGVYAMLDDETCWFLAIDFDKSTWEEDVRAVAGTARRIGLPVVIERSRSGNGAHVWFFFSAPVAATTARKMGCHLITETMARRHELSMDSYDRLFPSQDTMPRGGFGNLIALPLQHGPRQEGNSVFLDDNLVAFPDEQQWAFLASVERIDPMTAERITSTGVTTLPPERIAATARWTVGTSDRHGTSRQIRAAYEGSCPAHGLGRPVEQLRSRSRHDTAIAISGRAVFGGSGNGQGYRYSYSSARKAFAPSAKGLRAFRKGFRAFRKGPSRLSERLS